MTRTGGLMSDHRPVLKPEYDKQELPDARRHQLLSFLKSGISTTRRKAGRITLDRQDLVMDDMEAVGGEVANTIQVQGLLDLIASLRDRIAIQADSIKVLADMCRSNSDRINALGIGSSAVVDSTSTVTVGGVVYTIHADGLRVMTTDALVDGKGEIKIGAAEPPVNSSPAPSPRKLK